MCCTRWRWNGTKVLHEYYRSFHCQTIQLNKNSLNKQTCLLKDRLIFERPSYAPIKNNISQMIHKQAVNIRTKRAQIEPRLKKNIYFPNTISRRPSALGPPCRPFPFRGMCFARRTIMAVFFCHLRFGLSSLSPVCTPGKNRARWCTTGVPPEQFSTNLGSLVGDTLWRVKLVD